MMKIEMWEAVGYLYGYRIRLQPSAQTQRQGTLTSRFLIGLEIHGSKGWPYGALLQAWQDAKPGKNLRMQRHEIQGLPKIDVRRDAGGDTRVLRHRSCTEYARRAGDRQQRGLADGPNKRPTFHAATAATLCTSASSVPRRRLCPYNYLKSNP